jgi:hypothetical protein
MQTVTVEKDGVKVQVSVSSTTEQPKEESTDTPKPQLLTEDLPRPWE